VGVYLTLPSIDFPVSSSSLDPSSLLAATRAELATLQERYDALRADRDRLAFTLEMNMKKYKRFKRWVFATKVKVLPKATQKDKDRAEQCADSSASASQQQAAIKMLETPITPKSLSFSFLLCESGHADFVLIQNPDQPAQVPDAPQPSMRVHGEVLSRPAGISLTHHGTLQSSYSALFVT
jgi:hypothetical protein